MHAFGLWVLNARVRALLVNIAIHADGHFAIVLLIYGSAEEDARKESVFIAECKLRSNVKFRKRRWSLQGTIAAWTVRELLNFIIAR